MYFIADRKMVNVKQLTFSYYSDQDLTKELDRDVQPEMRKNFVDVSKILKSFCGFPFMWTIRKLKAQEPPPVTLGESEALSCGSAFSVTHWRGCQ